jgi:hypothetical protein
MKNVEKFDIIKNASIVSLGLNSLMFARIVTKYSIMGTLNFVFSSFILAGSVIFSRIWTNFSKQLVKEIYLMDCGKFIEIKSYSLWNNTCKIKISNIVNPEDNYNTKMKMRYLGTWILETRNGESFHILSDAEALHKDILMHIFKGIDIDLKDYDSDSDSDIIDI